MARKMKLKREKIFKTIEESLENVQGFLEIQKTFNNREKNFITFEFLQSLPCERLSQLWGYLSVLCQTYATKIVVQEGGGDGEEEEEDDSVIIDGDPTEVMGVLNGVVTLVHTYITKADEPVVTEDLLKIMTTLYDLLLILSDVSVELQNKVSLLCESWWSRQLKDKDQFVPNTTLYVVLRSVSEMAKVSDVKRVWSMRSAILLLDFEDDNANALKEMLLMTIISPLYLKSDEGFKFISFLFGLHPKFSVNVHQMMKHQFPGSPGWVVDVYGKVYFRAWRLAEGPYLTMLEDNCIQDLMFSAVHALRVRPNELFQVFRRVLNHFHQQMNQRQVQVVLYRLYKPILWRSLRVANDHVRANAVTLMMDAFPLVDPQGTKEAMDMEIQKQIDILKELLMDPAVVVRVSVIVGVCRILSCFWDMLPVIVIRDLLNLLISDLAFDSSSLNVRVAVIQGLCILLEQRLSHPVLKDLLPVLGGHLHDTAERVRLAFLDMLILVKGMRSIKVWTICPIDHLLARMEMDSPHVVRRIVSLLMDSLNTSDQGLNLKKCLVLMQSNPIAAWRFYQCSLSYMAVKDTVKFVLSVLRFVRKCIAADSEVLHEYSKGLNGVSSISESSMEMNNGGGNDKDHTEEVESFVGGDTTCVARLLEVVLILMEGCRSKFKEDTNQKLVNELAELLPELVEYFEDSSMHHLLYRLGSFVPKDRIPTLFKGSVDCLLTQQPGEDHEPLLTALVVGWNQEGVVMQHIKRGLEMGLDVSEKENRGTSRRNAKKRGRGTDSPHWPVKSVDVLGSLMSHPLLSDKVKDAQEYECLLRILKKSMVCAENILLDRRDPGAEMSSSLITACFSAYIRVLLHTKAKFDRDIEEPLQEAIAWCERVVLEAVAPPPDGGWNPKRTRNRKRKPDQSDPVNSSSRNSNMACALLENMLSLLCDILITGLCPPSLDVFISQFVSAVVSKVGVVRLFPQLSNLLYQLIEFCSCCNDDCLDNMSVQTRLTSPATLMEGMFKECMNLAETDTPMFQKVWSSIAPALSKGITTSIRHSYLSLPNSILPVYSSMARSFLSAYSTHLAKNLSLSTPLSVDDLPLFVHQLLALVYKDKFSMRLFFTHLDYELEGLDVNEKALLAHLSALHLINCLTEKFILSDQFKMVTGRSRALLQDGHKMEYLKTNYPEVVNLLNQQYEEIDQVLLARC